MSNLDLLKTPRALILENGRSPVAELNELSNGKAKWKYEDRNDNGMIKAEVTSWNHTFVGYGHNKRMAKNVAATEALNRMSIEAFGPDSWAG